MYKAREMQKAKELADIIQKIKAIDEQLICSDLQGMIKALSEATVCALAEVLACDYQPNAVWKPLGNFSDAELYRKLPTYRKDLVARCIEKFGEQRGKEYFHHEL